MVFMKTLWNISYHNALNCKCVVVVQTDNSRIFAPPWESFNGHGVKTVCNVNARDSVRTWSELLNSFLLKKFEICCQAKDPSKLLSESRDLEFKILNSVRFHTPVKI
jgi:hypothetical protein